MLGEYEQSVLSLPTAMACLVVLLGGAGACERDQRDTSKAEGKPSAAQTQQASKRAAAPLTEHTLLFAQAQFEWTQGADGKKKPKPGPAKLLLMQPGTDGSWQSSVLEDPDSRVFHKAACVANPDGETPRLLTIGGTDAYLKLWQHEGGEWRDTTLWHASFGGKWDRFRDFEIADVTADGQPDIVVATHDQGVVGVVSRDADGKWQAQRVMRAADTFIHEIEIGDVNGDGAPEFYATPSKPNKADSSQTGRIVGFRRTPKGEFESFRVAAFRGSHAKEILVADVDADGQDELYSAREAERKVGGGVKTPVQILQHLPQKDGTWKRRRLVELPGGVQARVLLDADLTANGRSELVVTTMKDGVWRLLPPGKAGEAWKKKQIDADSSGFEHAAAVANLDDAGPPGLYVTADDQDEIRQYRWDGKSFGRKTIASMDRSDLTWNITRCAPVSL